MKQLNFIILLLIITINSKCYNIGKNNLKFEIIGKDLFSEYLETFKSQFLPFSIDRKELYELSRKISEKNSFAVIKDIYKKYIPSEIKINYPESNFRSLYALPDLNDIKIVLIAQVIEFGNEQDFLKIYMLNYNSNGEILDYHEVAGYKTDITEKYMQIEEGYKIKTKLYHFKLNNDEQNLNLSHAIETTHNFELNSKGGIVVKGISKTEGYFELYSKGFKLKHKIE